MRELPLVLDGELVSSTIDQAAMYLGVSADVLFTTDEEAVRRWYNLYPYFKLLREYNHVHNESYFSESIQEHLLNVIFNSDMEHSPARRTTYDYQDVKRRLLAMIDSYSADYPGLKHDGQHLSYFNSFTETMFQYDRFEELITSYLDLVKRFRCLANEAWGKELSADEVLEYNFLVTCLGIRDKYFKNDTPLYYDLLKAFIPAYKNEGRTDIHSTVKVADGIVPCFWECANFGDNSDLAQQFAQVYPKVKQKLREVVLDARNFRCAYLWSDEVKPEYTPEYELYMLGVIRSTGDENATGAYHFLYVPKTEDELKGIQAKIDKLSILSGPQAKGGLPAVKPDDLPFAERLKFMVARARAMHGLRNGGGLHE